MRLRNYDNLRNFCLVARCDSFTRAADKLNLTKGAVSQQIDRLEEELGFRLFERGRKGIELTMNGHKLLQISELAFESIEQEVGYLRRRDQHSLTIGMATYFASRWLSPRLMHFITRHPGIGLRIQPSIDLLNLRANDLDMAIRWGKGDWMDRGMAVELIFHAPATLTANPVLGRRVESQGITELMSELNLLHDSDDSRAWSEWHDTAGLTMQPGPNDLVIPDPNVRLQAVIDGQGVGLYDSLIDSEVEAGNLYRYRQIELADYGYYLVYPEDAAPDSPIRIFRDWIMTEAKQ
ncbi:MAG: LysR substrate-binding domain-containing protein [Gammaproteobacteria bacterium]